MASNKESTCRYSESGLSVRGSSGKRPSISGTLTSTQWRSCDICNLGNFKSPVDFSQHLRDFHCSKEGGSYVCKYGPNKVCPSLPVDGVSDKDYEDHVYKDHMNSLKGIVSA